ncbi:MAG: ornithine--oxo-acid transaminase [Planctomycetota bacterium]|jgi:ornithine--oxo-acid transaminase
MTTTDDIIALTDQFSAHNYKPLPVVLTKGEGVWVWDIEGRRYMDMLSAYSALNQGHRHPKIIAALIEQAGKLTLTSRAFHNDQLGPFLQELLAMCEMDTALPMNSGAEAVETAIKAARKWGLLHKGVADGHAKIIACEDNFHGRTITTVSMSSEPQYREGFGPFTPGFEVIPYGDADALAAAIDDDTVAFLVEPIQGEAGVLVPPDGYLQRVREICTERNVLMMVDEIQTGLARTGKLFAYQHEGIQPDVVIVGKALSGGTLPVSAVASRKDVLGVFKPGDHGSTFGGSPLACAVARAALAVIRDEKLADRAQQLGERFREGLRKINSPLVAEIRGKGLLNAADLKPDSPKSARQCCEELMAEGLLCKETHETTIRFAPPLVVTEEELDWALERIAAVLAG